MMRRSAKLATATVGFLTAVFCYSASAQALPSTSEQLLLDRIAEMERQISSLKAEVESLRSKVDDSSTIKEDARSAERGRTANSRRESVPESPTVDAKKQAAGLDIGNGIRLLPYGTIYFNAFGNSSGTNNTDDPLWATASDQSNSGMSLRQTRFGIRFEGGRTGNAGLSGVVEADFYGGMPAVGLGENFGLVRLRVAKFKLQWEKTSVSVGQDWVVFAPLNPASVAAAAIPQFAASGNLWSRLPQVRVESKFGKGRLLFQGAVLAPASGDFPSGADSVFLMQPGAASRSGMPSFEGRIAFTGSNFLQSRKPGTLAVSGHVGRAKVNGSEIGSYALALDWNVPLTDRVGVTGEAFIGKNLGGFQGGIFQGYNPDFGTAGAGLNGLPSVRAIGSRGGWAQLSFTPPVLRDRLSIYGSLGMDDPDDGDLLSVTPRDWRSRNLSYAFNVIFKPTPKLAVGGEFRRFHTTYLQTGERTAAHFNIGAAYSF